MNAALPVSNGHYVGAYGGFGDAFFEHSIIMPCSGAITALSVSVGEQILETTATATLCKAAAGGYYPCTTSLSATLTEKGTNYANGTGTVPIAAGDAVSVRWGTMDSVYAEEYKPQISIVFEMDV